MAVGTFPTSISAYVITAGGDTPNSTSGGLGLPGLLNAFEVDITGLATKMGTGAATPVFNAVLVGNGTGTSTWSTTLAGLTLTTPTIASFVNAQHTHSNAAGGGTLGNAVIVPNNLATGATAGFAATTETTTSTSYAFLTTTTDQVTVTIGANGLALVSIAGGLFNSGANDSFIGIDVSGSTTTAANDNMCIRQATTAAIGLGAPFLITGLAAGSTTFKLKFRVSGGTGSFFNRRISAVPL